MNHESDVTLIDSHAKGDGGYDHLQDISHPFGLDVLSLVIGQLCVIVITPYFVLS